MKAKKATITESGHREVSRRRFIRYGAGAGAALVGAIAVTWADSPKADASPYCCGLAKPNTPCGGKWNTSSFSCPSGYHKAQWTCSGGGVILIICMECQSSGGTNCFAGGKYACSNYLITKNN